VTPSITKGNRIRERKRLERVAQNINGRNKTREIRHMLRRLYDIHTMYIPAVPALSEFPGIL
jgi:hypothetical protein